MKLEILHRGFRLTFQEPRNVKGPDTRGWNRLSIFPFDPVPRCSQLPRTRQGALDTARGMAAFGVISAYEPCRSPVEHCEQCQIGGKAREKWNPSWHVREDARGRVWLLGNIELGFAGFGHYFQSWAALLSDISVPCLKRKHDRHGFYWVAG